MAARVETRQDGNRVKKAGATWPMGTVGGREVLALSTGLGGQAEPPGGPGSGGNPALQSPRSTHATSR